MFYRSFTVDSHSIFFFHFFFFSLLVVWNSSHIWMFLKIILKWLKKEFQHVKTFKISYYQAMHFNNCLKLLVCIAFSFMKLIFNNVKSQKLSFCHCLIFSVKFEKLSFCHCWDSFTVLLKSQILLEFFPNLLIIFSNLLIYWCYSIFI